MKTAVNETLHKRARKSLGLPVMLLLSTVVHVYIGATFLLAGDFIFRRPGRSSKESKPIHLVLQGPKAVKISPSRGQPAKKPAPTPVRKPDPKPPKKTSSTQKKPSVSRKTTESKEVSKPAPEVPPAVSQVPSVTDSAGEDTGEPSVGLQMGGKSISELDPADFAYAYYLSRVEVLIQYHWRSAALSPSSRGRKVVVYFRVERSGRVSWVELEESSGIDSLDRIALRAVHDAAPLPEFPPEISDERLAVNVEFDH